MNSIVIKTDKFVIVGEHNDMNTLFCDAMKIYKDNLKKEDSKIEIRTQNSDRDKRL